MSASNRAASTETHDDPLRQLIARQDQLIQNFGELVSQHEALAATHGALLADHADLKLAHEQVLARLAVLEQQVAGQPQAAFELDLADREIVDQTSREVGDLSEFVTTFSKDVTAHLTAHDQTIIDLQKANEALHGSMATREQLEDHQRWLHHISRHFEARLEELAALPGTVTGLESRVDKLSSTSEAWLNELTALTADLSSRLSDQESQAWGISSDLPRPPNP